MITDDLIMNLNDKWNDKQERDTDNHLRKEWQAWRDNYK